MFATASVSIRELSLSGQCCTCWCLYRNCWRWQVDFHAKSMMKYMLIYKRRLCADHKFRGQYCKCLYHAHKFCLIYISAGAVRFLSAGIIAECLNTRHNYNCTVWALASHWVSVYACICTSFRNYMSDITSSVNCMHVDCMHMSCVHCLW